MTRIIALALATAGLTATAAAADSYLAEDARIQERDTTIEFSIVQSDSAGTIEVYDYNTDVMGELLGTAEVNAGANADVTVDLSIPPVSDVIALLRVDGVVVDAQQIDFEQ